MDDLAADLAAAGLEEEEQVEELEQPEPERGTRGYGERKHDEYASDVDAGDALAEADIYIAYGRYPQAVDLLKNASLGHTRRTKPIGQRMPHHGITLLDHAGKLILIAK